MNNECPYGEPDCSEDDPRTYCDGCREDMIRDHEQARADTFD